MRLLLPLVFAALAGDAPAGYYHPDRVAASSLTFARYAEALGPKFEEVQGTLARTGEDLAELEQALLLAGDRAPEGTRAWYEDQRRKLTHGYLRTQAHVSFLEEDSLATFSAAMERALADVGGPYSLTECAGATGIAAMTGPGRSGASKCEGVDLNDPIAKAMDADAALTKAVDEILGVEWPEVAPEPAPQPLIAITGTAEVVALAPLARALIGDKLDAHAAQFEAELAPLERGIESKDAEAIEAAAQVRARYEAAVTAEGQALLAALDKRAPKLNKELALCVNPQSLGGCEGPAPSEALLNLLAQDKKLLKSLK
ncbi:MAG: hypothetical protein H6739_37400 [Alphaproteobacteria bacterium]|nr:hypothetical protein [Alphaproteobacteria bacterium]